ncbi:hypothetical protein Taro_038070 [Colocasia esculenta]|uniref:Uncharacterized protein n=1 Tax=Colocasia esculenta TaxID=4460 RepID=A0A843W5Q5_COLES|nr:hypothetical protein [Colocasia esculenta]
MRISLLLRMKFKYPRMHPLHLNFSPLSHLTLKWSFPHSLHNLKLKLPLPLVDLLFHQSCVVLLGLHYSLACACGATVGPSIRDYETERLVEVLLVAVCPGGGTILVVDPWLYLMVVGVEVDWCSVELMLVLLPFMGRLPMKLVASATSCCNDLSVRLVA